MNYEWAEVYVSDFGLARAQEADGQVATTKQNFGPLAVRAHPALYHLAIHESLKTSQSAQWMAPEALKSREYSEATDAFSFGVLLWYDTTRPTTRHVSNFDSVAVDFKGDDGEKATVGGGGGGAHRELGDGQRAAADSQGLRSHVPPDHQTVLEAQPLPTVRSRRTHRTHGRLTGVW